MNEVFNSKEMKQFEKRHFAKKSSFFFMENAGDKVFRFICKNFKNNQPIIVLCGPGNNGGDGFIIAKRLVDNGFSVKVFTSDNVSVYKRDALKAFRKYTGYLKK